MQVYFVILKKWPYLCLTDSPFPFAYTVFCSYQNLSLGFSYLTQTIHAWTFQTPVVRFMLGCACPWCWTLGQDWGITHPVVVMLFTKEQAQISIFHLLQLAPTSSHGLLGKPERHTALRWTSQPNTLSSSTLLGQAAMCPWTAWVVSEIYSPSTWTS